MDLFATERPTRRMMRSCVGQGQVWIVARHGKQRLTGSLESTGRFFADGS